MLELKKLDIVTNVYEYGDYMIEVQFSPYFHYSRTRGKENYYGCYISRKQYGVKSFMFGFFQNSLDNALEIIMNNIDKQIKFYKEKYED